MCCTVDAVDQSIVLLCSGVEVIHCQFWVTHTRFGRLWGLRHTQYWTSALSRVQPGVRVQLGRQQSCGAWFKQSSIWDISALPIVHGPDKSSLFVFSSKIVARPKFNPNKKGIYNLAIQLFLGALIIWFYFNFYNNKMVEKQGFSLDLGYS